MSKYRDLTDAEINKRLAKAVGYVPLSFSPCTSRDDLAVVVKHTRTQELGLELYDRLDTLMRIRRWSPIDLLFCPPRIIAEACLEVLEG